MCSASTIINSTDEIHLSLLAADSRLTRVKQATTPCLELCTAVLLAKLDSNICRELEIQLLRSTFWYDSRITLVHIHNEMRQFKIFVATIRISGDQCLWQYVRSVDYPADYFSRCCELKSLVEFDCEVTVCSIEPGVNMTSCDTFEHLIKTIYSNSKL